jgi:hypothetical protein
LNEGIPSLDPDVVVYHKDGKRTLDEEVNDGKIEVWLRPLTGSDDRQISNSMIVMGKKGDSEVKAGTMDRVKVMRSVVKFSGLYIGKIEVDKCSGAIYDKCPSWLLSPIKEAVADLNAEMTEDESSE